MNQINLFYLVLFQAQGWYSEGCLLKELVRSFVVGTYPQVAGVMVMALLCSDIV